ncbi:MAG: gliding motility-associated C-terminal domain-containing protein [Chitinophagales bacterium]|nr:gliding motility-associated C-terminal domain-containing protein [Chitinophagales bacterium]MDW8428204.1 gliding motility-associated C-terminal domain-containing protein [Chitinophagales bacterium]
MHFSANLLKGLAVFFVSIIGAKEFCNAQQLIGGVINTYYPVMSLDICNNRVSVPFLVNNLTIGDKVLLVQIDGAEVDLNDAAGYGTVLDLKGSGLYELLTVKDVTFNNVTFQEAISTSFDPSARLQLIHVPQYGGNVIVAAPLQAQPWDGTKGGIIAFIASGTVHLMADIDASGVGFRGGTAVNDVGCYAGGSGFSGYRAVSSAHGALKGESISGTLAEPYGRGAPANGGGGGNDSNCGGGGGSNVGAGGQGGQRSNASAGCQGQYGGLGGHPLPPVGRVFLGGGGGAGDGNSGASTGGGNGGGIIIIQAQAIEGNGFAIRANGLDVVAPAVADGAGGGGGGGMVLLDAGTINNVVLEARGGKGGDVNNSTFAADSCFGPGGGGGGGFIQVSTGALPPVNVSGGAAGITTGAACINATNHANAGSDGTAATGLVLATPSLPYTPLTLQVSNDTIVCVGTPALLKATATGTGTLTYQWSNGATTDTTSVYPTGPTTYQITVTDSRGCSLTKTVTVDVKSISTTAYAYPDSIVKGWEPVYLNADTTGIQSFLWQPALWLSDATIHNPVANPEDTITYCVIVTGYNGCRDTACVDVMVVIPEPKVHIPNAFTPNGDGINDLWQIMMHSCYKINTVKVWNRWGMLIYDYERAGGVPWDGTFLGQPQAMETYMYYISVTCRERNEEEVYRGTVTLIR